jgi:hypothetical protein
MDMKKKKEELQKKRTMLENQIREGLQQIQALQGTIGELNKDALIVIGQIQLIEEIEKEK